MSTSSLAARAARVAHEEAHVPVAEREAHRRRGRRGAARQGERAGTGDDAEGLVAGDRLWRRPRASTTCCPRRSRPARAGSTRRRPRPRTPARSPGCTPIPVLSSGARRSPRPAPRERTPMPATAKNAPTLPVPIPCLTSFLPVEVSAVVSEISVSGRRNRGRHHPKRCLGRALDPSFEGLRKADARASRSFKGVECGHDHRKRADAARPRGAALDRGAARAPASASLRRTSALAARLDRRCSMAVGRWRSPCARRRAGRRRCSPSRS